MRGLLQSDQQLGHMASRILFQIGLAVRTHPSGKRAQSHQRRGPGTWRGRGRRTPQRHESPGGWPAAGSRNERSSGGEAQRRSSGAGQRRRPLACWLLLSSGSLCRNAASAARGRKERAAGIAYRIASLTLHPAAERAAAAAMCTGPERVVQGAEQTEQERPSARGAPRHSPGQRAAQQRGSGSGRPAWCRWVLAERKWSSNGEERGGRGAFEGRFAILRGRAIPGAVSHLDGSSWSANASSACLQPWRVQEGRRRRGGVGPCKPCRQQ